MRDLQKYLEICNNATSGPWPLKIKGNSVQSYAIEGICSGMKMHGKDADFISAARDGWPESINRAVAAEAEVKRITEHNDSLKSTIRDLAAENERLIEAIRKLPETSLPTVGQIENNKLRAEVEKLHKQSTEDIKLMKETLEAQKLALSTITKIRKALALAHSMILGGEQYTEQSRQVIEGALGLR